MVRTLSEEARKELEGCLPFASSSSIPFRPFKNEKIAEDELPVLHVRAFNREERRKAYGYLRRMQELSPKELDECFEMLRVVTSDWENVFYGNSGEEMPYKTDDSGIGADKGLFAELAMVMKSKTFVYVCKISGLLDPERMGLEF